MMKNRRVVVIFYLCSLREDQRDLRASCFHNCISFDRKKYFWWKKIIDFFSQMINCSAHLLAYLNHYLMLSQKYLIEHYISSGHDHCILYSLILICLFKGKRIQIAKRLLVNMFKARYERTCTFQKWFLKWWLRCRHDTTLKHGSFTAPKTKTRSQLEGRKERKK